MKYCNTCKTTKPKTEFSKFKQHKDGLKSNCKACAKINWQKHYEHNQAKRLEYNKQYRQNNKDKINSITAKRKSAKIQRTPPWLTAEHWNQIELFYKQAYDLSKTLGVQHHVDHIVPLRGQFVSGLHVPWNLQVLTASENCSKSNRV
jgi:5-methylcytosine-specific restriction endonuclease McrA